MLDRPRLEAALARTLDRTDVALPGAFHGKVRDGFDLPGGARLLVASDRISAFDHELGTIPFKGQILTAFCDHWFERIDGVLPHHYLGRVDPTAIACVKCEPLSVEFVVRAYATGTTGTSLWTAYEKGERVFCGHALPEGLRKHQRLEEPILTPTTKAPKGHHDESVSRAQVLERGLMDAATFDAAEKLALELFRLGQDDCAKQGLLLVDTKYELGRKPDGTLVIIDEIHTPDSSRFWEEATYEQRLAEGGDPDPLDKDYVRRWLRSVGFAGQGTPPALTAEVRVEAALRYAKAFERITGRPFEEDLEDPKARIERNVAAWVAAHPG
jgi:phosphoribosylaminoimidazole-succinocarboxamide synthase